MADLPFEVEFAVLGYLTALPLLLLLLIAIRLAIADWWTARHPQRPLQPTTDAGVAGYTPDELSEIRARYHESMDAAVFGTGERIAPGGLIGGPTYLTGLVSPAAEVRVATPVADMVSRREWRDVLKATGDLDDEPGR